MTQVDYNIRDEVTREMLTKSMHDVYKLPKGNISKLAPFMTMKEKDLVSEVEKIGGIVTDVKSFTISKRRYKRVRAKMLAKQLKTSITFNHDNI